MKSIQEELAVKKDLALVVVRFVEQVYTDLHGEEKYKAAARWLAEQAQKRGLKLTDTEIEG